MKKLIKGIISVFIVLFIFTGCKKEVVNDFYLEYKSNKLWLNQPFDVSEYGEYNDSFESESCAFGDSDVTYIYDDLEIEAYGNSKKEKIVYSMRFTSENIKTTEGLGLYDTLEDMIRIYGKDYINEDNKYTYNHNNTSLIILIDNDIINSIEYRIKNIV